jgi:hypothetical protein
MSMPAAMTKAKTQRPEKGRPRGATEREEARISKQVANIEKVLVHSKTDNENHRGHGECWPAPLEDKDKDKEGVRRRLARGPDRPEAVVLEHHLDAASRRYVITSNS